MTADGSAPSVNVGTGRPVRPDTTALVQALQLFGLCGFAVAYPLFDLLGTGPTFFIAHDKSPAEIALFAAVVLCVPPLVLLAGVRLVHRVSTAAARWTMAALFGCLVALAVLSALDRAAPLRLHHYVLLLLVLAGAPAAAYARLAAVRSFATFLAPMPLLFAGLFLFLSPASALVLSSDPDAIEHPDARDVHVAFFIFDELPLGALLDAEGHIDSARFPGFGRLAETSTWYPHATTVSPGTVFAVPATLTGTYPDMPIGRMWPPGEWDVPPVAGRYPRSLFTMLAGSHTMNVYEWVTQVCPRSVCGEDAALPQVAEQADPELSFPRDVSVILRHQLLPTRLAERWLPPISGQWAGFGTATADDAGELAAGLVQAAIQEDDEHEANPSDRFEAALPSITAAEAPQLWFAHERLPHRPARYLRDGISYPRHFRFDYYSNRRRIGVIPYRQQYMLQVQHVDRMVDRLMDRLEAEGLLDDSMVIVMSDHGLSFQPHGHPRAIGIADMTDEVLSDVLPVPLFVKYPGQRTADIDLRQTQLTDILPTIADVLGVSLPDDWQFDGRSLHDEPDEVPLYWQPVGILEPDAYVIDPLQLTRQHLELFGPSGGTHDLYALGPFRDLIGEPVSALVGDPVERATVSPVDERRYDAVSLRSGVLPALYEATVGGIEPGTWTVAALNGRLAGTGPVVPARDGDELRLKIMLDPTFFRSGRNEVAVYLVEDDGAVLRPVPVGD